MVLESVEVHDGVSAFLFLGQHGAGDRDGRIMQDWPGGVVPPSSAEAARASARK